MDRALRALGEELARRGHTGEILLAGGAWMVLILQSRNVTKDIDAYLAPPAAEIRDAASVVGERLGLPPDWLNDGIKGFFYSQPPQRVFKEYPGLIVYAVEADYMLAMKAMAHRDSDRDDVKALIRHLELDSVEEAMGIVRRYVPDQLITPGVNYFLESVWREAEAER